LKHLSTDREESTERPKVVASEIGKEDQGRKDLGIHSRLKKRNWRRKGPFVGKEKGKRRYKHPYNGEESRRRSKFVHEIRIEESRTAY